MQRPHRMIPGAPTGIARVWPRPRGLAALMGAALIACLSLPAFASESPDWATGTPDFEWSGALKAGQTVEIKSVNGSIIAGKTSGDKVEIRAWKHGHHSDPAEVKIEMVPSDKGITVCAVYPSWWGKNTCEPGSEGHMDTHNNDVQVHFVVRVPAGVGFTARTVNGSVTALGLTGPTYAHTVNGSVDVSTSGMAEAQTVNGSIRAELGASSWNDPIDFRTVNGRIELSVPSNLNADLEASTVNGTIESDLPVTVHGDIGRRHLRGKINKGGSPLRLETVNGGIKITTGT